MSASERAYRHVKDRILDGSLPGGELISEGEIAEALGLTEAQVFHALSYFFDHRDEIASLMDREEQAHAEFLGR